MIKDLVLTDQDKFSLFCYLKFSNNNLIGAKQISLAKMMNFNIDFLSNHLHKDKSPRSKFDLSSVQQFVKKVSVAEKKYQSVSVVKAFRRISVSKRKRVQVLSFVESMVKRRMKAGLFQIRRYAALNQKVLSGKDCLLNYPVMMLRQILASKITKDKAWGLSQLTKNSKFIQNAKGHIEGIEKVQKQYIRRIYTFPLMRILKATSTKKSQYRSHVESFEYLFDCIRIRAIFECFTQLSIRTLQKSIGELEKRRTGRRDSSRTLNIKRISGVNEIKRKMNHVMGQITEIQVQNNHKRVTSTRQNGLKLTRINGQTRNAENNLDSLQFQIDKMEKQISRKEDYIQNRSKNVIKMDKLAQIHIQIAEASPDGELTSPNLYKIVSRSQVDKFKSSLNYLVLANAKLKHQMNLYEKTSSAKKQSYIIANHENDYLKEIFGSLIHHNLISDYALEMTELAGSIKRHTKEFKSEWRRIKSSSTRR